MNENVWISLKISLKFVPTVQINNMPALVLIMAWRRLATSHYLNWWWFVYWRIYASLGLNELKQAVTQFIDSYVHLPPSNEGEHTYAHTHRQTHISYIYIYITNNEDFSDFWKYRIPAPFKVVAMVDFLIAKYNLPRLPLWLLLSYISYCAGEFSPHKHENDAMNQMWSIGDWILLSSIDLFTKVLLRINAEFTDGKNWQWFGDTKINDSLSRHLTVAICWFMLDWLEKNNFLPTWLWPGWTSGLNNNKTLGLRPPLSTQSFIHILLCWWILPTQTRTRCNVSNVEHWGLNIVI